MNNVEQNTRIENFIARARMMLSFGLSQNETISELVKDGAVCYEAVNAVQAAVILNEMNNE